MSNTEPVHVHGRRGFMRRVAGVLAAGVGVTLFGAAPALAAPTTCCKDSTCPSCPGADVRYKCTTIDTGRHCCVCHADVGQCYGTQFVC